MVIFELPTNQNHICESWIFRTQWLGSGKGRGRGGGGGGVKKCEGGREQSSLCSLPVLQRAIDRESKSFRSGVLMRQEAGYLLSVNEQRSKRGGPHASFCSRTYGGLPVHIKGRSVSQCCTGVVIIAGTWYRPRRDGYFQLHVFTPCVLPRSGCRTLKRQQMNETGIMSTFMFHSCEHKNPSAESAPTRRFNLSPNLKDSLKL